MADETVLNRSVSIEVLDGGYVVSRSEVIQTRWDERRVSRFVSTGRVAATLSEAISFVTEELTAAVVELGTTEEDDSED